MSKHKFDKRRFVKVRIAPHVFRTIEVQSCKDGRVVGFRVNDDASHWEHETKDAVSKELVVASEREIVQELRHNLHYGMLEPVE